MENKAKILSLVTVCSFLISGFASCVSNLVNLSTKKRHIFNSKNESIFTG